MLRKSSKVSTCSESSRPHFFITIRAIYQNGHSDITEVVGMASTRRATLVTSGKFPALSFHYGRRFAMVLSSSPSPSSSSPPPPGRLPSTALYFVCTYRRRPGVGKNETGKREHLRNVTSFDSQPNDDG